MKYSLFIVKFPKIYILIGKSNINVYLFLAAWSREGAGVENRARQLGQKDVGVQQGLWHALLGQQAGQRAVSVLILCTLPLSVRLSINNVFQPPNATPPLPYWSNRVIVRYIYFTG